jgi:hypothetical protein
MIDSSPSPNVRSVAATIAGVALVFLGTQMHLEGLELGTGTLDVIWSMARYFTNLTNLGVAAILATLALRGRWPSASLLAAMTLWIVAVGAVYHALLASTHHPKGLEVWTNQGLHTIVPIACLGLWVSSAPKGTLRFYEPYFWTLWPMSYAIRASSRAVRWSISLFFSEP